MKGVSNRPLLWMTATLVTIAFSSRTSGPSLVHAAQQPAEKTIPEKVRLFIPYKAYSAANHPFPYFFSSL
jgi:hypothetical protein